MQHQRRSRLAATAGSVLLTLAAVGGVVCILAVIAALFFQISLIMFKTGSMSPTIPAGSVALVRQVPANQVHIGDVVTVDRPGELPITHRIVGIAQAANGAVALTLRGDANPQDDPAPYLVAHVRLVLTSVPGAAPVIVAASNPIVLGSVTLAASLLVGWAFWPRRREDAGGDVDAQEQATEATADHGGRHRAGAGAASLILAFGFAGALTVPLPARAATTETVVSSRYLTLTSIADADAFAALTPGSSVRWIVGVSANPPDPATIHLGLSGSGTLAGPGGLRISVVACTTRWTGGSCPGKSIPLLAEQPVAYALTGAAPDGVREFGTMPSAEQRWIAVDVTLPSGWRPGSSADLRIHAWGAGDQVQTAGPPASLAATGTQFPTLAVTLAAGAVIAGVTTAGVVRRRRGVSS
ncbi:MAG: signal peptidase I [Leifsonia sp.]